MKKVIIAFVATFMLITLGFTQKTYAFPSYEAADFGNGIPDGWVVEGTDNITSDGVKTTIRTNTGGDPFTLKSEGLYLPLGIYEVEIRGLYASDNYGSGTNSLTLDYTLYDPASFSRTFDIKLDHTFDPYMTVEDARWEITELQLQYQGGYDPGTRSADYIEIESIEFNRVLNVEVSDIESDALQDFTDADNDKTVSAPAEFTQSYLQDATVYYNRTGLDYGFTKITEKGELDVDGRPIGNNYEDKGGYYKAITDYPVIIYLVYEDATYISEIGGDYDQGDVVTVANTSDYPIDVVVMAHDGTIMEEEWYAYPLEDYYYYHWNLSEADITYNRHIYYNQGSDEYFTNDRLNAANILIDGTEVLKHGRPTFNISNGTEFSELYDTLYGIRLSDESAFGGQLAFAANDNYVYDPGELQFNSYSGDGDGLVVEAYLPKDPESVGGPSSTEPDVDENPNAPAGFQALLTHFGLWNTAGVFLIFGILVILSNVFLSMLKLNGIAIVVIDIVIMSVFMYMGILPLWAAAILLPVFIAIIILTFKGGGHLE